MFWGLLLGTADFYSSSCVSKCSKSISAPEVPASSKLGFVCLISPSSKAITAQCIASAAVVVIFMQLFVLLMLISSQIHLHIQTWAHTGWVARWPCGSTVVLGNIGANWNRVASPVSIQTFRVFWAWFWISWPCNSGKACWKPKGMKKEEDLFLKGYS